MLSVKWWAAPLSGCPPPRLSAGAHRQAERRHHSRDHPQCNGQFRHSSWCAYAQGLLESSLFNDKRATEVSMFERMRADIVYIRVFRHVFRCLGQSSMIMRPKSPHNSIDVQPSARTDKARGFRLREREGGWPREAGMSLWAATATQHTVEEEAALTDDFSESRLRVVY